MITLAKKSSPTENIDITIWYHQTLQKASHNISFLIIIRKIHRGTKE